MKKKSPTKTKKDSPDDGRTVKKDKAGHVIEELYGFHIISPDDIEHHSGGSLKKSGGTNQKNESSSKSAKTENEETKSKDDSANTQ